AHHDRRAGLERLATEAVDERLSDREALALDQGRLTVRADRLDDEVHVRILPVEARDCPFDQYLLGLIEHRLAVMSEGGRPEWHGRCENAESRRSKSHDRNL